MEEIGKARWRLCCNCNDPQYQRSCHVRNLRGAVRHWTSNNKKLKKVDVEMASSIQACARLELNMNCGTDIDTFKCNQDQIASLNLAAEAILAVEECRTTLVEKNKAALEASHLMFGSKGVIPRPEQLGLPQLGISSTPQPQQNNGQPMLNTCPDGWQPRWEGDIGDPFDPYQQLIEQFLHTAITFHSKALESLSTAFGAIQRTRKVARDYAYLRTLAANAGITVKEYQRFLEMFKKIDVNNVGTITKRDLMTAMKRDKDIAAFMQLSRARGKDGRRESFDSVFNRIDCQGLGAVTWESFLHFFSGGVSIGGSVDMSSINAPMLTPSPMMLPKTPLMQSQSLMQS